MADDRAARLDALNEATFKDNIRHILDRGLNPANPESALHKAYRPGGPTLLEALRANAEQVFGDTAPAGKRPRAV